MMEKYLVFVIAFGVLVCDNIRLVQCFSQCKTHADCRSRYRPYCCSGYLSVGKKDRTCTFSSCLNRYCSSDSDCGDQSMCCRSNTCVNKGCSGCNSNTDCYSTRYSSRRYLSHVCCKKTFPLNQTVCAVNCINQTCNSNNDCGHRWSECCRSGKCVTTGCRDKCTSNSECNLDQYCCKKKRAFWGGDNCAKSCVGEFCQTDDDCGAPNVCCISNTCVDRGCSGCSRKKDCYSRHVCCKKTFPLNQTVCSATCVGQTCNSNDDCGRWNECCRSRKCVTTGCYDECTSNSECNLDQYCCKHKKISYREDNCAKSCVGEFCRIDDDCGAPNVCCISNTCVDRGCFACTNNADCSTGQYCCKNRHSFSGGFSVCSEHCIGKSCNASNDCGGPGETCNSDRKCATQRFQPSQHINPASSSYSFPSWLIAVITVSLVVFLITVGIMLAVFWYMKRKRAANATQTVAVSLQDTQHRGAQMFASRNLAKSRQQANGEKHGFDMNSSPIYEEPTFSNEVHQDRNQLHNPVYHTLESPETTKDTQLNRDNSSQQLHPQNTGSQGNDYNQHPPYNPMYQSNR